MMLRVNIVTNFIFILFVFAGIRDYVHVMDLAEGHVAALKKLQSSHVKLQVIIMKIFL